MEVINKDMVGIIANLMSAMAAVFSSFLAYFVMRKADKIEKYAVIRDIKTSLRSTLTIQTDAKDIAMSIKFAHMGNAAKADMLNSLLTSSQTRLENIEKVISKNSDLFADSCKFEKKKLCELNAIYIELHSISHKVEREKKMLVDELKSISTC
ncbi:TPA: hypothetical protein NJ006_005265 [Vibrio parahaemolyticus]|nr:hypothetical protein [Vibrio parahaemolyticus]HCG5574760.1 hypothetical protein [Vibrio parahaemolyticus]HCG5575456.1 hypothetical protein [Vibrio parahaemolyticus]